MTLDKIKKHQSHLSDLMALFRLGKLKVHYLALSFVLLMIAAVFEGFSFGLLAPFLKQAAGMGAYEGWRSIPVVGRILQDMHFEQLSGRIDWLLLVIVLAVVVRQAATYISQILYSVVTHTLEAELRITGYKKILFYGCLFFDSVKKGEIHNILMRFTLAVASLLTALFSTWQNIFFSSVYVLVLWQVSPQLCLLSFLLAPVFYLSSHHILRLIQRLYRQILRSEQASHGLSLDIFSNIKLIKALGREAMEGRNFEQIERGRVKDNILAHGFQYLIPPVQEILMTAGLALIIWISFTHYFKNDPAFLIKLIVSLLLFRRALQSVNALISNAPDILKHYPFVGELNHMLNESGKGVLRSGTSVLQPLRQGIEYRNLIMGYGDVTVLKDISCFIPAGSFTAIVGASGAGKTTFVELLPRFYEFQHGDILIDGVSVRDYDLASLRAGIGFVSQETLVLNDTLYNNILFANPEASRQNVLEAARRAHVLEFVENLEHGIDSIIGDRGVKLSGGELQRLSIARVMLRKPLILILDEATSALDSVSERFVQESFKELSKSCTTLAIAHRLATVRHADLIIVINQGVIVEQGKLEDLLSQKGLFYRYWEAQRFG